MNVRVWFRTDAIKASVPLLALSIASLPWTGALNAQQRAIDTGKSAMTVRVYKAGLLSALGHDHEIAAPISEGMVDPAGKQVELRAKAASMQVRDPGVSDKDRQQIQSNMVGPEVLDAGKYPEIVFRSTSVEPVAAGSWKVQGNLMLHGQTGVVTVEVREQGGHYLGKSRLKLTDFGIKPIRAAGGSIRVRDEVQIEFDIQLAR